MVVDAGPVPDHGRETWCDGSRVIPRYDAVRHGRCNAAWMDGHGPAHRHGREHGCDAAEYARGHIRRYLACSKANRPKATNPNATAVSRNCPNGCARMVRIA